MWNWSQISKDEFFIGLYNSSTCCTLQVFSSEFVKSVSRSVSFKLYFLLSQLAS